MSAGGDPGSGRATDRVPTDWPAVVRALEDRDGDDLTAIERDRLADALFWVDRLHDSLAVRRAAYRDHVAAGDHLGAAAASWRLFYEHFLVGEDAIAGGWIARCRRHVDLAADDSARGWLRLAEADIAMRRGEHDQAIARAGDALVAGRGGDDTDLVAMALHVEGRARIAAGQRRAGLGLLDEAMVAVINDELDPLFTGWVFCNVVSTCYGLADLQRASEWSEAAMRWCATLRDGRMYRGLCRVYAVEIACLRGRWAEAEAEITVACAELTRHDPRYAGSAHHLAGELHRRRGDLEGARREFARAQELGHLPQPGHALLCLDEGRPADALGSLRTALLPGPAAPLPRAELLMALITIADELGAAEAAAEAADEVAVLATRHASELLDVLAVAARGLAALVAGDPPEAVAALRTAVDRHRDLGLPYEAAKLQVALGRASLLAGDAETAVLELRAALEVMRRLGAVTDAGRIERRLADHLAPGPTGRQGLTDRELEVLAHLASGRTNREIAAELVVSPHTVARHVSNIFAKLGVNSRAAATARAYEAGLLGE